MLSINLTNHFLIAMPNMADPYFAKTLTYVCEHNDQGALGIVVNRPIDMTLQALFERLTLSLKDHSCADAPIYFGGPVQTDRGFVLHQPAGEWQSTLKVSDGVRDTIGLTMSKDILEAVGRGEGPSRMLVSLGYAGWSAGQIEHELKQNAWLTVKAKDAILFDMPPDERLGAAMRLLGIDFARLADQAGHA
ncbi:MAG: YqgE/AlgH family protein [Betaproteobacteria bacterium]